MDDYECCLRSFPATAQCVVPDVILPSPSFAALYPSICAFRLVMLDDGAVPHRCPAEPLPYFDRLSLISGFVFEPVHFLLQILSAAMQTITLCIILRRKSIR